jgi:hypothetical protein
MQTIMADGRNVVPDVWETLDKIKGFSEKVGLEHQRRSPECMAYEDNRDS